MAKAGHRPRQAVWPWWLSQTMQRLGGLAPRGRAGLWACASPRGSSDAQGPCRAGVRVSVVPRKRRHVPQTGLDVWWWRRMQGAPWLADYSGSWTCMVRQKEAVEGGKVKRRESDGSSKDAYQEGRGARREGADKGTPATPLLCRHLICSWAERQRPGMVLSAPPHMG